MEKSQIVLQAIWENEPLFNWLWDKDAPKVSDFLHNSVLSYTPYLNSLSTSLKPLIVGEYIGMHLRAEGDLITVNYKDQVLSFMKEYKLHLTHSAVIYLAVGSKEIEDKFREEMKAINLNVVSKWSLASLDKTLLKWNEQLSV